MFIKTNALILREVSYRESDRMLTLYSPDAGRLSCKAPGARRSKSKLAGATQMLTYSELVLKEIAGKLTVTEASVLEDFHDLRLCLEDFALGCYFAECVDCFSQEEGDPALLQLILNSLYALTRHLAPREKIKAVFELRLAAMAGYAPSLEDCAGCGCPVPEHPVLSITDGKLYCVECAAGVELFPLYGTTLQSLRAALQAEPKQMLSFPAEEPTVRDLSRCAEQYFLYHAGRNFSSLSYYRSLLSRC